MPFPPPGDLPDPKMEPVSPLAPALTDKFFITELPGKPQYMTLFCDYCILDTQKLFFVVEFIQFGKIL